CADGKVSEDNAGFECARANGDNAAGERVAATAAIRPLDQRGLVFVEQDTIHAAVKGAARIHDYCCQPGVAKERSGANGDDALGNADAGQKGASGKRVVPDRGYAVANSQVSQP